MFIKDFSCELKTKPTKLVLTVVALFTCVSLLFVGYQLSQTEKTIFDRAIKEENKAKTKVTRTPPEIVLNEMAQTELNSPSLDCAQVASSYKLLGVVFNQNKLFALLEKLETGTALLINEIGKEGLRLTNAELSSAGFQHEQCQFTLSLNNKELKAL